MARMPHGGKITVHAPKPARAAVGADGALKSVQQATRGKRSPAMALAERCRHFLPCMLPIRGVTIAHAHLHIGRGAGPRKHQSTPPSIIRSRWPKSTGT